jgi:site-specific recombinase XerD
MAETTGLEDLVGAWLCNLDQAGRSAHTLAAYRRGLTHFVRWYEGSYGDRFDPTLVIPRDVRDWKAHQQAVERAAPTTVNQRLVALSQFFGWAVASGFSRNNPAAGQAGLSLPKRHPKALSDRDLRKLLRAVHGEGNLRDIAMVELLAGTGLRVSEVLALQIGDVTLNSRSGVVVVRRGKRDGFRQVPLTSEVRTALRDYLATRPDAADTRAPLWLGERGPLKDRSGALRLLNKYTHAAGLQPISVHALRHTFATRYLAANPGDLRNLAALLGHRSLNTVMVYTEPTEEDLAERVQRAELSTA